MTIWMKPKILYVFKIYNGRGDFLGQHHVVPDSKIYDTLAHYIERSIGNGTIHATYGRMLGDGSGMSIQVLGKLSDCTNPNFMESAEWIIFETFRDDLKAEIDEYESLEILSDLNQWKIRELSLVVRCP